MLKKLFISSIIFLSFFTLPAISQNIIDFNGTWIGEVEVLYTTQVPDITGEKAKIKLVINKNNVELYTYRTNLNSRGKYLTSWKDFMRDRLTISRHKSNAVITGMDSGSDERGDWVDTISIELSQTDRKYASVNFTKQSIDRGKNVSNVFGTGRLEVVNNNNR